MLRIAAEPATRILYAPAVSQSDAENSSEDGPTASDQTLVIPRATLVVEHTMRTQLKIARLIERLSKENYGTDDEGDSLGHWPVGGGFWQVGPER